MTPAPGRPARHPPAASSSHLLPEDFTPVLGIDPKAARVTWTAAATLLALFVVYTIRGTIFVFLVALLFAYLLYPLADAISRRFSPANRAPALGLTYLIVIGVLVSIAVPIGSHVVSQARDLAANPPDMQGFMDRLRANHPDVSPLIDTIQGHVREQFNDLVSAAPRFGLQLLAASANLIDLILIPVLSFFILKDGRHLRDSFVEMFSPGPSRTSAAYALADIHILLLAYMRALFFLCSTVLIVFSIVLSAMGVPFGWLLATVAFFCEFVPVIGPLTSAALIIAVSAFSGYPHVWWIVAFLGAFRVAQDYIVSPRLMSHSVELHPLFTIFGVFAGAEIGGVRGVFLSVPVLAVIRLVILRFRPGASSVTSLS
jgi:predicted PurR-regulated permease PerM